MSASQMRRLTAEYANQPAPPPVPADVRSWLDSYQPRFVFPVTWQAIRTDFAEILLASRYRTVENCKRRASELAGYLAWRHETGLGTGLLEAMTLRGIDLYIAGGCTNRPGGSKNTVRTRLRKLAERANPSRDTVSPPIYGHPPVKPPYDPSDEARIVRAVSRYRSPILRRKLCLIVGLCFGAGLDAADFRGLLFSHIADFGEEGIRVDVPGTKARTVWVRRDYEAVVRAGLDGVGRKRIRVIGGKKTSRNSVASVFDDATFHGTVPHIEAGRMRSTWLVWALARNLPLPVIMQAAGLKGARTLTELVPYVPDAEPGEALR